jgi:RNase H-like domain found in reverse transcriptase
MIDRPIEFAEFDLSSEQLEAFNSLKAAMVNPPVLAIPEVGDELILDTDASNHKLGCVLQLRFGGKSLRPVGYWSRMMNSAEANYSATEKESLAIVWAVKTLPPYVERKPFKVRTDHCALRWLYGAAADGNSQIERWRLTLANFDFKFFTAPA